MVAFRITCAALPALFALALLAGSGCKSSADTAPAEVADADTRPPTPPEWDRPVTRPDDATAQSRRAACAFARGAMPGETLGASAPLDKDIPIETVVVLMQENRSFDSYFGHLGKYAGRTDIESAPETASNADSAGTAHPWTHAPHLCEADTNHEWSGSHQEYGDGKMDGFVLANDKGSGLLAGERAMWWYDERELPFYYEAAKAFAVADHYHASLLGPTWPNRMYLYSATSFGKTSNIIPDISAYPFPDADASVFDELEKRHVSWTVYHSELAGFAVVYATTITSRWGRRVDATLDQFYLDAAAGTLPQVVFLDALALHETASGTDEHPPADIQNGQKLTSDVVHALMKGPQWKNLAMFLTYDEHGGLYDHVPPPAACAPDATPPKLEGQDVGVAGGFDRLGIRVPLVVISPWAKRSYVSHVTYDHTSITRFLETKWKLPALTARDANADPMLDLFDFHAPSFVEPPPLPEATVDANELSYCVTTFGK